MIVSKKRFTLRVATKFATRDITLSATLFLKGGSRKIDIPAQLLPRQASDMSVRKSLTQPTIDCAACLNPKPHGGKGAGSSPNKARMARLQSPAARQKISVSNHGDEADPHLGKNSVLVEPNNSEGDQPYHSSSNIGGDAYLVPCSND